MSETDLGTARGKIVLDTDLKGVDQASEKMEEFGKRSKRTGEQVRDAGPLIQQTSTTALVAGGVIAAGFALAVKAASDFEFGLSAVKAVSGATAEELEALSDKALQIGRDTAYSGKQAVSAMEELAKAGLSIDDILNGAADATVALAAAGGVELPEAATIAAAALNQFKLEAEDLTDVADLLSGAANASATSVSGVGAALGYVGPVANAAGLSIDETAHAIALLANNGIEGQKAGTALRSILAKLSPVSAVAAEAMGELGLITEDGSNAFYDAEGNIKSMSEIIGILNDSMGGLNEQQKITYATTIFGTESLAAIAAMAGTTSGEFDTLAASIDGVSAADVAAERLNNLDGSMTILKGSIETAAIVVGQNLTPVIKSMVDAITLAVNWFTNLSESTHQSILVFGGLAAAGLIAFGVIGKMVGSFIAFRKNLLLASGANTLFAATTNGVSVAQQIAAVATRVFNAALAANPILKIVTIVGLLIAALVTLAGGWDEVIAAFKPIFEAVKSAFEPLIPIVQDLAKTLASTLGSALEALMPILQVLIDSIFPILIEVIEAVAPIIGILAQVVAAILGPAMKVLGAIIGALAPIITVLLNALMPLIDLLMMVLVPVLDAVVWALEMLALGLQWVVDAVVGFFTASDEGTSQASTVWQTFTDFLGGIISAIAGFFQGLWDNVVAVWDGIMAAVAPVADWFTTHVGPVFEAVVGLISKLMNFLWELIEFVWQSIFDFVSAVVQNVSDFIASVWGAIIGFVAPIFKAIFDFVSGIFQSIYNFVAGIVDGVVSFIRDVWSGIVGFVKPIFEGVYNAIKDPLDDALEFIGGIQQTIMDFFAGAGQWLVDAGRNIIDGLVKGIEGALGWLTDVLGGITDMIPNEKGPPSKDKVLLEENGELIMKSLVSGLQSQVGNVMGLLGGLNVTIPAALDGALATSAAGSTSSTREFNYYAAPGAAQLSGEDELELAMRRGRTSGW